jgi:RNA polymerase sigma-70 factor (ECF subfamily)
MTGEEFKKNLMPYKNKLFRLASKLLSNRQEAEDAVQEVYLKIWKMRHDLEKYNSTEGLMMTMTRNLCLDKLKSKKNKHQDLNSYDTKEQTPDPYEQTALSDAVERVRGAIENLPEQQKTIVQLRDVEGYELKEIAEIMGADTNYVRVNLSRGRKKIRETLQKVYNHANG